MTNMYYGGGKKCATWNPFVGCRFDCSYCKPTFQAQAKRQKHNCRECYDFTPHCHPERLDRIPNVPNIFVCGNGDISFCPPEFMQQIIDGIKQHLERCPDKTFLFQSKRPEYFEWFLGDFPPNVILGTTLETNELCDYRLVSKAPLPDLRFEQLLALDYPRKFVTVEPVMDFELWMFAAWLTRLKPEHVWIGFNSRPKQVQLPEPSSEKVMGLMQRLVDAGIEVRGKNLRGLEVPKRKAGRTEV